jgi:hypothetical protein
MACPWIHGQRRRLLSAMLGMFTSVTLDMPRAQDAQPWPPEMSDNERRRIDIEPAHRQYQRWKGFELDPERNWIWLWRPRRPDGLSGKRGDFWTQDELERYFGRRR